MALGIGLILIAIAVQQVMVLGDKSELLNSNLLMTNVEALTQNSEEGAVLMVALKIDNTWEDRQKELVGTVEMTAVTVYHQIECKGSGSISCTPLREIKDRWYEMR